MQFQNIFDYFLTERPGAWGVPPAEGPGGGARTALGHRRRRGARGGGGDVPHPPKCDPQKIININREIPNQRKKPKTNMLLVLYHDFSQFDQKVKMVDTHILV